MNEAVVIKNSYTMNGGGKGLVCPFKSQDFWKCIGYILSAFTYGNKAQKLWSDILKAYFRIVPPKLRRDVCKKAADESMRAIRFRNTPQGDLPHYSFIFSKPDQLGTDMKNVEGLKLGTMLHLETQKGKEAMKM